MMSENLSTNSASQTSASLAKYWVARLGRTVAQAFVSSETYRDGRLAAPKLRTFVLLVLGLVISLVVSFVGIVLCYRQLEVELSSRLKNADQTLSQGLMSIQREIEALPENINDVGTLESSTDNCSPDQQKRLTRAAIDSTLVGQFYLQRQGSNMARACGSFGAIDPYWQFDLEKRGIQIVPSQNIQSAIVIGIVRTNDIAVAVINPAQLTDRLNVNKTSTVINLVNSDGLTLASTQRLAAQSSGMLDALPRINRERAVADWPLELRATLVQNELARAFESQVSFWLLSSILATMLVSFFLNRRLQKVSSRAWRLQRALKKRRFAPVVQPIVDAANGKCIGMEILMRWKHPTRGLVPPAEFIDYAERSGLIVPMSDLLMRQAHRQLSDIALANPSFYFSFNITPAQLRTVQFSTTLLEIFDGDPIGPERVLLELTERDLVDDQVRDELVRLRSFGFKIAIDDFGTGQSSLAVLQDLVIDKLKIDRAFVNTVSTDSSAQPVLDAIIDLAHRLKINMVAEGIETELQQNYLVSKGVQALQGYRFARPLTPIDFAAWLASTKTGNESSGLMSDSLSQVLIDLQQARVRLERNRWHFGKRHKSCLLGNELVTWLAQRYQLSRADALKLGQRLLAKGFLVHVFEEHDLEDAPFFYRLLNMQAVQEALNVVNASTVSNNQLLGWLKGPQGVVPGTRQSSVLRFNQAVRGSEVTDALMQAGSLSRPQALAGGVQLMRAGLLKHAFDEEGFVDSRNQFYYLTFN